MKLFFKISLLSVLLLAGIKVSGIYANDIKRSPTQEELDRAKTNLATALNIGSVTGVLSGLTFGFGHYVAMKSDASPTVGLGVGLIAGFACAVGMREARKEAITKLLGEDYASAGVMSAMTTALVSGFLYFMCIGAGLNDTYNKKHSTALAAGGNRNAN